MSDYGRYDDTRSRERGGQRGYSRNSDSIFSFGDQDRERQRDRHRDRGDQMGGWAGSGRTSAYDQDRSRSNWTSERENFGSGRQRGERMSSGWGDLDRDRHRDRDRDRMRERGRDRDDSEHRYGRDDERGGLPIDETSRLIASNKVEGTAVYGSDGARLGSIYNFMVNKYSGRVEYAVMTYGGFLGMGTRYYPLPWQTLTYDTDRGGYRIAMREQDLRDAPSFDRNSEPRFDENYSERVHSWYGLNY